jgi:hemerythrin-like domain-containing protein
MPVVIGAKPGSNFKDPIGLLTDCHRRIERFLSILVKIGAQGRGGPLGAEERTSLETALSYFRDAAPKHTADEESTLFPRLRRLAHPELQPVLARVDALERDHARANQGHAEIDRLGRAWLEAGLLAPADAERFSTVMAELAELYKAHIAIEESELFPAAAGVLSGPDREAMGAEMAARRGL